MERPVRTITKAEQLREILRGRILSGEFAPGDQIPSQNELARQYGLSYITVRDALAVLSNEGILYRVQGSGTFVADLASARQAEAAREAHRRTFGAVLSHLNEPFHAEMAESIDASARRMDLRLLLSLHHGRPQAIGAEVARLSAEGVRAILVSAISTQHQLDASVGDALSRSRLVVLGPAEPLACHFVTLDRATGIRLGMRHLYTLGHRAITLITTDPRRLPWSRAEGFVQAIDELGLDPTRCPVVTFAYEDGPAQALQIHLESGHKPTAIIAHSDAAVPPLLNVLRAHGLTVPDDLSIIGFDNTALATQMEVPLTTISQRIPDQAAEVAGILRRLCNGELDEKTPASTVLDPELVIRASTGLARR